MRWIKMFYEVNTDHVSIHKMRGLKNLHKVVYILRHEKRPYSGGKFDEYFDRLLSDSESEETNLKLHVCDKNNFIGWNQRQ